MEYNNTPTVVAVITRVGILGSLLVVRRNNEPGKGLLGLPGGYQMAGETWQEAGAREVLEETGYSIDPNNLVMLSMATDEYGNNLVIAANKGPSELVGSPDGEVQEVVRLYGPGCRDEWAFPRHHKAALEYLW